ncbi:hypothetical protein J4E85_008992 [Alternaria conjuncta]|uniref:uncharacterized protein n=1 Tax=Alternaria conjuncta TaxID=181017 RepID=UPI00222064BC|nr:uncharacterized protein J4E85_008992 [Alternaria conjuncta]KAI4920877.1 hypothetical protein J4E85_008992 [Alternaria conjuncta]
MATKHSTALNALTKAHPRVPLPLSGGESKPADPRKYSLVTLPAELRNKIFGYLVEFSEPVKVTFRRHFEYSSERISFSLQPEHQRQMSLLLTCRTIYSDVASAFYANNKFLIAPDSYQYSQRSKATADEIAVLFFQRLGSQVHWIRKVILDITSRPWALNLDRCAFPYTYDVFEVGILLRFLWHHRLAIDVAYLQAKGASLDACNPPAMTRVMRCILEGQIMLKASRSQMLEIAIKYDGSGGMFRLGKALPSGAPSRFAPDRELQIYSFAAEDSGRCLTLTKPTPPTLLTLPAHPVLSKIFSEVLSEREKICIDLAVDTSLPVNFTHANRRLHETCWASLLQAASYTLLLHSREKRSTFTNFSKLARILRRTFTTPEDPGQKYHGISRPLRWSTPHWKLGDSQELSVVLEFDLADPTALEDLRISVLPLLLETSSYWGDRTVTIRSLTSTPGGRSLFAEQTITFQELRLNALNALNDTFGETVGYAATTLWINGLGKVVETEFSRFSSPYRIQYDPAKASGGVGGRKSHKVSSIYPKNQYFHGQKTRHDCRSKDCKQLFPSQYSAATVLEYLEEILTRYDVKNKPDSGNAKKEKYLLGQLCPVEIKGLSREDDALWKARIDRGFLTLMNTKCGY